jgi:hypothetical protein
MEKRLSPSGFVFAAFVFTLALLGVSIVAPQNPYYRWQEHTSGTTRKADWIYERLHFDPAPIDVALIGTSRSAGGLSGPDIERAYCKATGRRIHVANLSIPETGRNMHYVIAKEAMRTKKPALTIIELNEVETRKPHNGFVVLADTSDVLSAPILINLNYFSDLARLPGRQALLWFETLTGRAAVRTKFDPSDYLGHDLDRTRELPLLDGRIISRFVKMPASQLNAAADARRASASDLRLPSMLRPFEYRFSRIYLEKISALAAKGGRDIAYVYLPAYQAPVMPEQIKADLGIEAPIIDLGGPIANDPAKWLDATHVNAWGAIEQSARFAAALAEQHPVLGEVGCK